MIQSNAFTRPTVHDFNGDGLLDMVLAWYDYDLDTKAATQQGRIYLNQGSAGSPKKREISCLKTRASSRWDSSSRLAHPRLGRFSTLCRASSPCTSFARTHPLRSRTSRTVNSAQHCRCSW